MAWFKVDDGWWSHPKTLQLSDGSVSLWTRAGSWACQHLTDGFVPTSAIRTLGGTPKFAHELVKVGYWETADGGWVFHDWADYQEPSETVKKRRADARERMRAVRANKTRTEGGGSQEVRSTPTRPDPTRPVSRVSKEAPGGTTDAEPPQFCSLHWVTPSVGPCPQCGDARRIHAAWVRAQKNKPTVPGIVTADYSVECPEGRHKWTADGTCAVCPSRREVGAA